MHRTQIYFEENMFEQLKQKAAQLGVSVSAYIRDTLQKELKKEEQKRHNPDLSSFAGLWKDRDDISVESLRDKAWK